MPHTPTDYDLIVGYLGSTPELPDDERAKIESWIIDHSDERPLTESIARVWASHDNSSSDVRMEGLLRLLRSVETASHPVTARRRRSMVWRVAAAAAVLVAVVFGALHIINANPPEPDRMLITANGSVGEFTLPDGSHVWLNGNTTLAYNSDFSAGGHRRVKVDGEAYFNVTHDTSCPFVVDMTDMEVEVVGTSFEVRNYEACQTHDIVLRTGCVKVRGPWGKDEITMKPDEMLALNRTTGSMRLQHADAGNYCRWFEQFPSFDNEPLANILINVSRRHGLDLTIDDDVDTTYCLSVTMGGETLESIMNTLAYLSPIRYQIRDNDLHISRAQ